MTIAALLDDAFTCLATEHAAAHAHVRDSLGARRILARVDHEDISIELAESTTTVRVRTNVATLCDVLNGDLEVIDAVLADRLEVIGSADDLVALGEAMIWFVEGAMRCVSIPGLIERLFALRKELHGE